MNTIKISASTEYQVKIGAGLLSQLGQEAAQVITGRTAAILSDSNVWPLYGQITENSLKNAGFHVYSFVISAGEASKSGSTYLSFLNFLAEHQLTRSDCIIALGGGVVGDLAGFAAATYLRGIGYIQVPTTLLAAVDSSVGGKTAIDLEAGKNLAGAFYQPKLVLCDTDTLSTLPAEIFRDGCAEVIKYGVLYDPALFAQLEAAGPEFDRPSVISRCVELKRDVVAQDEFDTGLRQKLNLGHTVGHAIEALSHYTVSHGQAVAIGMAIVARSATKLGNFPKNQCKSLISVLEKFELQTHIHYSASALFAAALTDKKRTGDFVNLIVPEQIGHCVIQNTPVTQLETFLEAGL